MTEKQELEGLLKNIQEGLSKYSVKELNEALLEAIGKKSEKKPEIDFVLNSVASRYNITVRALRKAKSRGVQQDAKQVCYCLLHLDVGLPVNYISSRIFFNWPNSVWTGLRRMENANQLVKSDRVFLESYKEMQVKLIQYITSKNNDNGNT